MINIILLYWTSGPQWISNYIFIYVSITLMAYFSFVNTLSTDLSEKNFAYIKFKFFGRWNT